MEIIVKGRHTDVSDRFRRYVDSKIAKVEKLDPKVMEIDVEVSEEHNPRQSHRRERVELTIYSRGPVTRAEAAADDRFAAFDMAIGKLESRLRRMCDRRKAHHGRARLAMALAAPDAATVTATGIPEVEETGPSATAPEESQERPDVEDGLVPIPMEGDGPVIVREKSHKAQPMTIDQALFEMELVGHDFFLFRDKDSGDASVVYRRRGWDYGLIRLIEE